LRGSVPGDKGKLSIIRKRRDKPLKKALLGKKLSEGGGKSKRVPGKGSPRKERTNRNWTGGR